jgi:hemolysin type calcium-binding protein
MTTRTAHARDPRRALALGALGGALVAAWLGFAADPADAAYKARVDGGTLKITGDGASDKLSLRLGAPTVLQVDVGQDGTADFSFDRTTFTAIDVEAAGGDDEVRVDQSGGVFTDEAITINGGAGNDTLIGAAGNETFLGGGGDDFVDGNIGADTASLGSGNDRFQWDPGDGSDTVDGQGGTDALAFNGSNIGENIGVSANGSRVRLTRNVASIAMDLAGIERTDIRTLGGADNITVDDLAGTDLKAANVNLNGFDGGPDASPDTVIANGTDQADDLEVGSEAGNVVVSPSSTEVTVTGNEPTLDSVTLAALGGDDTIAAGVDFNGSLPVNVDGGAGTDTTTYSGTGGDDTIGIARNGTAVAVFTPTAQPINNSAVEELSVKALGGADAITGQNGIGTLTHLTIDGGSGADVVRGGDGADTLLGGTGDDLVDGNIGADTAQLGAGDDTFQWDPGDGSDTVEGQSGNDGVAFNGSNIGEDIAVAANGPRVRLTRNVASVAMDFDGIERTDVRALGGADNITIDNLAGTDLKTANVHLGAFTGEGDGALDTVIANGADKAEHVRVTRSGAQVLTTGLAAQTTIDGSEPTDVLRVNALGGRDDVQVAPDVSALITPIVDLGAGQ